MKILNLLAIALMVPCVMATPAFAQLGIAIPVVDEEAGGIQGFEGPIEWVDPAAQSITVMGAEVVIPDALVIDGTVGITGATLADLEDEAAPSKVRSLFSGSTANPFSEYSGGTFKGLCVDVNGTLVCTELVIELAENVAIGPITEIDVEAGTFKMSGVNCKMNADERFPAELLGLGLEPITWDDIIATEGAEGTGVGYYVDGTLHVCSLETEILPAGEGGIDTIRITRVRGRDRRRGAELRVQAVTTFEEGKTVDLQDEFGSVLDTQSVELDPITGEGEVRFRLRTLTRLPASVTVVSSGGGTHTAPVE